MNDSSLWPNDYFDSRNSFLEQARVCGARTRSYAVESIGPSEESLSVETASFGNPAPHHVIVLTSGTHGVEGFLGAAVQRQAMRKLAYEGLDKSLGVVMVHAVNPWGFAHLRRVDDDNVDVNRNFSDDCLPGSVGDKGYAALDPLINPKRAPGALDDLAFWFHTGRLILRHRGIAPLARPIAEGQSLFPKGLFYSGTDMGESSRRLQDLILDVSTGASRITHLDVHSGLGRRATATLIGNTNVGQVEGRVQRLQTHFGQAVVLDDAPGNVYSARGTLSRWYQQTMVQRSFLYLCVEIGTVNPLRVLSALKRENQAHHWTSPTSKSYRNTKMALRDVFAPTADRWRHESLAEGLKAFDRALRLPIDPHDSQL